MGDEREMYLITVFTDSLTASSIVRNQKGFSRDKYIVLKFHQIKELIETHFVDVKSIATKVQAADIFTEASSYELSKRLSLFCGLIS